MTTSPLHVLLIVGTNRRHSVSGHLTRWLAGVHEDLGHRPEILDLADMPPEIYSSDDYSETANPESFGMVVRQVQNAESFVVIIPEYNGGMPGSFKHWVDRLPHRDFLLGGRPVSFVGVAAGEWGGLRPVEQAQAAFLYRKSYLFPERIYIRDSEDALDDDGVPRSEDLRARLRNQAQRFGTFARCLRPLRNLFTTVADPG